MDRPPIACAHLVLTPSDARGAQTRSKVAYTLGRLGPAARARLGAVRLRPDVRELLAEVEDG